MNANYHDDGSVDIVAHGEFATCGSHNSGHIEIYYENGILYCMTGMKLSQADCIVGWDRAWMNGTHSFGGYLTDCQDSNKTVILTTTVDQTPSISILTPTDGSKVSNPFDIVVTATFKPRKGSFKGSISCYDNWGLPLGSIDCSDLTCSLNIPNVSMTPATYALNCQAFGPPFAYAQSAFQVTASQTKPSDDLGNGPSNCTGGAE